jgi:hypothetical protein
VYAVCRSLERMKVKGGVVHGRTDELGFHGVENQ